MDELPNYSFCSVSEAVEDVQLQHMIATGELLDCLRCSLGSAVYAVRAAGRKALVRGRDDLRREWPSDSNVAFATALGPVAIIADPKVQPGLAVLSNDKGAERRFIVCP